jgi:hypothetical protein
MRFGVEKKKKSRDQDLIRWKLTSGRYLEGPNMWKKMWILHYLVGDCCPNRSLPFCFSSLNRYMDYEFGLAVALSLRNSLKNSSLKGTTSGIENVI